MMTVELFSSYNRTELYQICRELELNPMLGATREDLIDLLLHRDKPELYRNVFDTWRTGIAGFVIEHWSVLQNQVRCPLKTKDPESCFGCLDTQVTACIVDHNDHRQRIEPHRK